jgi:hypothetical protein
MRLYLRVASLLNRVFGLLAVILDTLCNSQQLAVVPSYNLLEGCNIVSLRRVNESQMVTRSLAMRGRFTQVSISHLVFVAQPQPGRLSKTNL